MFASNTSHSGEQLDAQFNYVTMLLPGNGTNGAQNNTFLDASTNNFTITRNGNTTQGSFSPYGSLWSNYFDGTGDYLSFADNAAFNMGTGNFTAEFWLYTADQTNNYPGIISASVYSDTGAISVRYDNSGHAKKIFIYLAGASPSDPLVTSSAYEFGQWIHVAIVRDSTTALKIYVNGTLDGTGTITSGQVVDFSGANSFYIGRGFDVDGAAGYLAGYVSNVRLVKGTAVYTSNFTPSTTPLTAISGTSLLTCQSNRFIDNSTNNFTITRNGDVSVQRFSPFSPTAAYSAATVGGSGYFDGAGDYLTAPDNTALEMGSSDFTMEAWLYPNDSGWQTILTKSADTATAEFQFYAYNNAVNFFGSAGSTWNVGFYTGAVLVPKAWNHVAVTRSGSSWTIWVNGVSQATATASFTISNNTSAVAIGAFTNSVYYANGYLTDVRIVKGTAVYTAAFTPPTAPLTAITNTSLLCNFTNGAIFDNSMKNDLETVGNAQISTSVKKYGTGSLYFDGNGDWCNTAPTTTLEFGSGNFTMEFWLYPVDSTRRAIYHGSSGTDWSIGIDWQSQKICIWASSNGTSWNLINADGGGNGIGTTTVALNTWTHVAFVRSGTTWQTYINGVRDLNLTGISGSIVDRASSAKSIGKWFFTDGSGDPTTWNGYIDDFRVTKGVARYTANFTPPTAAFPTN